MALLFAGCNTSTSSTEAPLSIINGTWKSDDYKHGVQTLLSIDSPSASISWAGAQSEPAIAFNSVADTIIHITSNHQQIATISFNLSLIFPHDSLTLGVEPSWASDTLSKLGFVTYYRRDTILGPYGSYFFHR
ncbi:MAG: hypothetical protein Q8902_11480 [Bacteroidota bacterium]|nr:hypothetical protein [Bacteroidota bacterium]MDP4234331.1 hypothetical protein [Bacteroidota bacterium]MDP4243265.1 hypothetical protein [Bacteroidota bacterium]